MNPHAMPEGALGTGSRDILLTRTPLRFKVAHVLVGDDYFCLDLNIRRATKEALYQAIQETIAGMKRDDTLPAAPAESWEHFRMGRVQNGVLNSESLPCLGSWFSFLRVLLVRE